MEITLVETIEIIDEVKDEPPKENPPPEKCIENETQLNQIPKDGVDPSKIDETSIQREDKNIENMKESLFYDTVNPETNSVTTKEVQFRETLKKGRKRSHDQVLQLKQKEKRVRNITSKADINIQLIKNEENEDAETSKKKARISKRKRSRSTEACNEIVENARRYLLEHPSCINLDDPTLFSFQSVRENMANNRDEFISRRVIALLAEDVIKEYYQTELFRRYEDALKTHFPTDLKDVVQSSDDMLIQSMERILDQVEIDFNIES